MKNNVRRTYDHRIKDLIKKHSNPYLFQELGIPVSTARQWLHRNPRRFVTCQNFDMSSEQLVFELESQKKRYQQLASKVFLLQAVNDIFDFKIDWKRLPNSLSKLKLLHSIEIAKESLSINECLRTINISSTRYHHWKRKERGCELEDYSSCPKSNSTGLTFDEIRKIGDLVTSPLHIYFSIKSLALYAMRQGVVFASSSTWGKLIQERGWIRPKKRLYPDKPKIGLRADKPNAMWHIDASVIRLVDGTKAYIQAVIDNCSRYIVAWKIASSISGLSTKALLTEALRKVKNSDPIQIISDGGPENDNQEVRSLEAITLTLAQIDIEPSNSMIEYFFKILKHRYLFLKSLDDISTVIKHTGYFIDQHNHVIPQQVLGGATPAETYFGRWNKDRENQIATNHLKARKSRMEYHRSLSCRVCSSDNVQPSSGVDVNTAAKLPKV